MKQVKVLGPGCPRCRQLAENVQQAVGELDTPCEVEKVTDIGKMSAYGVLVTPALVVDGKVLSAGKVLGPEEIKELLA